MATISNNIRDMLVDFFMSNTDTTKMARYDRFSQNPGPLWPHCFWGTLSEKVLIVGINFVAQSLPDYVGDSTHTVAGVAIVCDDGLRLRDCRDW